MSGGVKNIDAILKENVLKPGTEFRTKLESRLSMTEFKRVQNTTMFVEDEEITINGEKRKVKRLFVRDDNSNITGVGWIINEDITACMICGLSFGIFRWPHHCRSCGNLVCNPCSPHLVTIVGMEDLGDVRACVQCYWGQFPVYPMYQRREEDADSYEGSVDGEDTNNMGANTPTKPLTPAKQDDGLFYPEPVFAVYFVRKLQDLDSLESRAVYVNICMHKIMKTLPEEKEYIICDDVILVNDQPPVKDINLTDKDAIALFKIAEIYHAILRPELVEEVLLDDNLEGYVQVNFFLILFSPSLKLIFFSFGRLRTLLLERFVKNLILRCNKISKSLRLKITWGNQFIKSVSRLMRIEKVVLHQILRRKLQAATLIMM
jgi:hypothetical protein